MCTLGVNLTQFLLGKLFDPPRKGWHYGRKQRKTACFPIREHPNHRVGCDGHRSSNVDDLRMAKVAAVVDELAFAS